MKQSDKRKHAVALLYISGFYENFENRKEEIDEQTELYFEEWFEEKEQNRDEFQTDKAEIIAKFKNAYSRLGEIDPMISGTSNGWKLDRMGRIDLAIMRMAVYEMYFDETVPSPVAISEAVILAKAYGGDDSSQTFINGILGNLEKNRK